MFRNAPHLMARVGNDAAAELVGSSEQDGLKRPLLASGADCKFVMPPPKKQKERRIPKVGDMNKVPLAVPSVVHAKLGSPQLVLAFDVETNDFVPGPRPLIKGQFGHWSFCTPDDLNFKLLQIGWAVGEVSEGARVECQEILVRPDGFAISERARRGWGCGWGSVAESSQAFLPSFPWPR